MDSDFLVIGRLGAPKGVRGDLKIQSYSGEFAHFRKLKEVELRGEDAAKGAPRSLSLKVTRIEGEGSAFTMAFEGYPSPETARTLTGLEILVPRSGAAPLRENEWYVVDLIGLSLVGARGSSEEGAVYGQVRSVLEGGSDPWLEVVRTPGAGMASRSASGALLVPFRKEFVGEVDLSAGTIELLAPWLLDE